MKRKTAVSPITLREVYAQKGDYIAKMMIDPSLSQEIESVAVDVRNSDGTSMNFNSKRWGTKLTVSFMIDSATPDGVSVIDILLRYFKGTVVKERFDFWVIKDD